MKKTPLMEKLIKEAEYENFLIDKGKHSCSFYDKDLPGICVGIITEGELCLSAEPSFADSRAKLTHIAKEYGFSVQYATALMTSEPELGPGLDY